HVAEYEAQPVGELVDEEPRPDPHELACLQHTRPTDACLKFEHRLLVPPPSSESIKTADEIAKCASEEHADAIVIGTCGKSGVSRLLAGSVAQALMHQSPCPVIAISQPAG